VEDVSMIYVGLNFLGVVNILLISLFLLLRKQNAWPNIVLSILLSIPGLYLIDNILIVTNTLSEIPYYFFFVQLVANIFPIGVYYYVHLLMGDKKKYHKILLTGSFSIILYGIGLLFFFSVLTPDDQKNYISKLNSPDYPLEMLIYNLIFYIWQMVYFVILLWEISRYRQKVSSNLSDIYSVNVVFVRQFVQLLAVLNLLLVVFYIFFPMPFVDYGLLPIVVTIIYAFIIYFSIQNNAIFDTQSFDALNVINQNLLPDNRTFEVENDHIEMDELIQKIDAQLTEQKLYKQSNLTLTLLAEILDEKPYIITNVIRSHYNKNFNHLINEYRVNEALTLLKTYDSKKDKIENIALAVGFNSRATFYRSFKQHTGKSPIDFVS
jgi:AraC-like DNA-binding protein